MAVTSDDFRNALSRFASGVTVVTTCGTDGKQNGLTVSAFCSVSLEPPLVLICIEKAAAGNKVIADSMVFAVNILSDHQAPLSEHFASPIEDRMKTIDFTIGRLGLPIISDSLCTLECSVKHFYDGGDHTIFVGQVEYVEFRENDPLIYFRSGYREIA